MARVNINVLGISDLKRTRMGEFNSDDHYIYYCGQESLTRNGVALIVNKSPKCRGAAAAKSLQSCPTLWDPLDGSPPGSPVPGILQARTLGWVPFPSPRRESENGKGSGSVMSDSLWPHGLQPTRLLCPWDSPGTSTGVGCHCLLRQNAVLGCNLKNDRMISVHFQGKPFNITVIQVYAPTTDAKEAGWTVLWRPIDFIELTSKKKKKEKMSFSS